MTALDTSPEAVERIASIIVKPLSTLKESFEAAALLRALDSERSALSGELARARERLVQYEILEAVRAGRMCICHAVDGNGSPILGDCPMHGPQVLHG